MADVQQFNHVLPWKQAQLFVQAAKMPVISIFLYVSPLSPVTGVFVPQSLLWPSQEFQTWCWKMTLILPLTHKWSRETAETNSSHHNSKCLLKSFRVDILLLKTYTNKWIYLVKNSSFRLIQRQIDLTFRALHLLDSPSKWLFTQVIYV